MIMQISGSLMIFAVNRILKDHSGAVSVFGIYYKTWTFLFMPISGLAQGLLPIIGYNFGAKKYDRVTYALQYTLKIAITLMSIGTIIFLCFPHILLSPYHFHSSDMLLGISIYRIFAFTFIFTGISVTIGFYFLALGNDIVSMTATLIRQLIIPVPLMIMLINLIDIHYIWIVFILSELLSATYCYLKYKNNKLS